MRRKVLHQFLIGRRNERASVDDLHDSELESGLSVFLALQKQELVSASLSSETNLPLQLFDIPGRNITHTDVMHSHDVFVLLLCLDYRCPNGGNLRYNGSQGVRNGPMKSREGPQYALACPSYLARGKESPFL